MIDQFRVWYEFVLQQMAAESYLENIDPVNEAEVRTRLSTGNNRDGFLTRGFTRFTDTQAEEFLGKFRIVDQWSDNPTPTGTRPNQPGDIGYLTLDGQQVLANSGLSATLIRKKDALGNLSNEYTLAIRSTEFRDETAGGDRDRDLLGADLLGIVPTGFALAQLVALEDYYASLKQSGKLPQGASLAVSGYSLGGHLATVFTEIHAKDADVALGHAYTFNGAGRGTWNQSANDPLGIVSYYRDAVANPEATHTLAMAAARSGMTDINYVSARRLASQRRPLDPLSVYGDSRHRWAQTATHLRFGLGVMTPTDKGSRDLRNGAAEKVTQLYGREFPIEATGVANTGVHGPAVGVFAEAQPFLEGRLGIFGGSADFGNAHAIVLIADSLAVMRAYQTVAPGVTLETLNQLFSASSNRRAQSALTGRGENASAEDDALENALDSLRRLFLGTGISPTPYKVGAGGAGDFSARNLFYENLAALESNSKFKAAAGRLQITLLTGKTADDLKNDARTTLALRYALKELNPFIVTGDDSVYQSFNQNGELDLFNSSTQRGALSNQWIEDRAKMLAASIDMAHRNSGFSAGEPSAPSVLYFETATNRSVVVLDAVTANDMAGSLDGLPGAQRVQAVQRVFEQHLQRDKGRKVLFGADGDSQLDPDTEAGGRDELLGTRLDDKLYGGAGNDTLRGEAGKDHLQGDVGDDYLSAGADNDTLFGGRDHDVLNGGLGEDIYRFYPGDGQDEVFDIAEGTEAAKRQLGKIFFGERQIAGTFTPTDPEKKNFTLSTPDGIVRAYYTGNLGTATPGRLVLWRDGDDINWVTLQSFISSDFGIVLGEDAPQRQYTDKFGTTESDNSNLSNVPHASSLESDAPDQKVFGLAGADFITVSHANTQGFGGADNDFITNGEADQSLFGEAGRDVLLASAGEDNLYGGTGDDALQGGADSDYLEGDEGNDVLDGGAGEDVIAGGDGHDFIFGGGSATLSIVDWNGFADGTLDWGAFDAAGNVLIRGLAGLSNVEGDAGDVITGGSGNDWVFAGDGNDAIAGGADDDYLVGQAGNDRLNADEGADALYGDGAQGDLSEDPGSFSVFTLPEFHGKDSLSGGAGDDFISGDGEADELYGGEGDDTLVGDSANVSEQFHGADYLDGGDGNDVLIGYGKDDTLFGGTGDDNLGGDSSTIADSAHGDDYLDGEDGTDVLHGDGGADTLFGGAGDDTLDGDASNVAFEFHGDDYLEGEEGNDALQGGGGSDRLFGGAGNDSLAGDVAGIPLAFAGDDYLDGEAGTDILDGGAGNDTLTGGAGVDTLMGGEGDDLYLVDLGSQNDFIQDVQGANTVRMGAPVSFVFQALGSDGKAYLGLRYSSSDIVHIQEGLTNSSISTELSDGTVRTAVDWRTSFNQFVFRGGTPGADMLSGSALAELFSPGAGNDTILFDRGSGFDRVSNFGQTGGTQGLDKVQLGPGVAAGDVLVKNVTGHLTLTISDTGDTLQLDGWFATAAQAHAGAQVQFADGTTLNAADLTALALVPSDGNDLLTGGNAAEVISGGAGNDDMAGGAGADTLLGGEGDDKLSGGAGADTYVFGTGDGNDTLQDTGSDPNVVQFGPEITPADVTLNQGSIVVTLNATGDTLTIANWYREESTGPKFSVQELRFADGTTWGPALINENANHATPFGDLLRGIDTADTLYGLSGDDTIEGFSGDDVLVGGDGNDVLDGGEGGDDLDGGAGNDTLKGGANADVLDGGPGDDTLDGGAGENVFFVGEGHDFVIASGEDTLVFHPGVEATGVSVIEQGLAHRLEFASGSVVLSSTDLVREVRFADGTVWSREDLASRIPPDEPPSPPGGGMPPLPGVISDNTLEGTPGNDLLAGGFGSDTYVFGYGSGNDTVQETFDTSPPNYTQAIAGERDRILFAPGVGPEDVRLDFDGAGDETIGLFGSDDTLTIRNPFGDTLGRVEFAEFADGTVWDLGRLALAAFASPGGSARHFGTPFNDFPALGADDAFFFGLGGNDSLTDLSGHNTLYSDEANDSFSTGSGDDVLHGGAGNDSFSPRSGDNLIHFGRGAGQDTLTQLRHPNDRGSDIVAFAQDVKPEHVRLRRGPDATLIIELAGTPDSLTIRDGFFNNEGRARLRFQFADGTLWDAAQIDAHIQTVALIEGGTGNNSLVGGDGADQFVGGPGNDTLTGGGGQDTFVFWRGDGTDTIIDEAPRVLLGEGILPQDVTLSPSNFAAGQRDLIITIAGGGGQITARNWFPSTHSGGIEFADGTLWDSAFIGTRVPFTWVSGATGTYTGTQGNDSFSMSGTADTMRGEGGDDTLSSDGGNDQLFGGAGNDTLLGAAGNDVLSGGAGDDLLDAGVETLGAGETDSDALAGGEGNDLLFGRTGNDALTGNVGDDDLEGGAGDDLLEAGPGDDLLDGGEGDDRLYGGSGSDTYWFGSGSGNDKLLDFDATGAAIDAVRMGAGVAPQDVEVMQNGGDLILRLLPTQDSLTIRSFGRAGYGIERVVFEDGTTWDAAQLAGMAAAPAARERADVIFGSAGDVLAALGGDDIIDGGTGADLLDGGSGDDVLIGGAGDDTLVGGAGFDHLTGGAGGDTFVVAVDSGSDAMADLGVGDTLTLGAGISPADVKIGRDRDHLYLESGATGQFITLENWFANGANGTVTFSDGTQWDAAFLEATADAITDGDDFLVGTSAGDTVMALAGLDTVLAGDGNDLVLGGEGSDTLHGEAGDDTLAGEAGFDLLQGGEGNDSLDGGLDDDALLGDAGDDALIGGEGFDDLTGGAGDDALFGGDGEDVLVGGEGADLLDGGTGNDALNGGSGNDVYVYAAGSGSDTITESESTISTADTLRLLGLSPSEVGFRRFATHSVLEIAGSTDTVTLSETTFQTSQVVERVEFNDGTIWNQVDIALQTINVGTEGNDFLSGFKGLVGLGGNDTLLGGPGDSLLDGGAGADTLIGGAGNDTYVFGRGYGEDTVSNFDPAPGRIDVLAFTLEVTPQEVLVERLGNQLHLVLDGGTDRLRVDNWFSGPDFQLSEVRFADGTVWSAADVEAGIAVSSATEGDDVLVGLTGDDTIDGLGGDDRLEGGPGNDTLIGNTGNDTLLGGSGNDVYVFGPGMGSDTISDTDATAGNVDVVQLDVLPGGVTVTQQSPHLVLTLAGGERLTLLNWSSGDAQKIEEVHFSDGTVWDVARLADLSTVPIIGTEGADFLQGTNGADTIDARGGNDIIFAGLGSDTLTGGDGNDTLNAESGNDMLDGGTGNDVLNGGVGNDTYRFAPGYGLDTINELDTTAGNVDVVEVDALASDATVRRAGANLELRLASGDMLVMASWFTSFAQQVELVRFADGTAWDVAMLDTLAYADLPHIGTALADTLFGTNEADSLEGLEGNDRLEGRGGDDVLVGGSGNDTLLGGLGNETYRFAAGNGFDTIFEQGGFDVLEFGPGIAPADVGVRRIGDSVFLSLSGGTDQVTLSGWAHASSSTARIEEVRFADGTLWDERFIFEAARASDGADFIRAMGDGETFDALMGNDVVLGGPGDDELLGNGGDDSLSGEAGADTLDGGPGRDLLQGGAGDDRFAFGPGYGTDWLTDSGGADELVFGSGLTPGSVIFTRDLSNLFATSGADRLTLVDWFSHPGSRVESFRFGDGTVLNEGEVRNLIRAASPTSLNDTIFGSDSGETILGSLGEDALYGEGGNDTLDGQAGSDYMLGGSGDDTYHVDVRLDRVTEDPGQGLDTVIAVTSYTLPANVENLTLSGAAMINGTGNPLDNTVVGNAAANVLDGGAGNDSLHGGAGNDVYLIRRAEGSDEVVDFDPAPANQDAVRLGADIAPSQVRVSRIDNDIQLRIAGGGEAFVRNWFDPAYRIESVIFADGTVWDAATIELLSTLPPNRPPVLSAPLADLSTLEDSRLEFAIPAGTFSDPDAGDTLTYAATLAGGSVLPGWLLFDATTVTFSGTPGNDDVGALDVLVTAADAFGDSASDEFRIEVQNVNDAPLANDDTGAAVEDGGPITLNAAGILANDLDVDAGDTKTIVAATASTAGAAVGVLDGDIVYDVGSLFQTLGQDAIASDAFTYTMADAAGATSSATVDITVTGANDAPVVASALADQVGREAELLSFAVPPDAFADVDAGDTLSLAAGLEGAGALPSWLAFDAVHGTFLGAPDTGDAGSYRIEVTATDSSSASAADVFELAIESAGGQGQTIIGTPDDDVLTGTAFDDFLDGRGGSDRLVAGAGNDVLAYSDDGRWNGHFHARHAGSPGHAGSGDTESIAGKNRSHDIFDGGDGFDVLVGTDGHDALFLQDHFSPPDGHDGPRLASIEYIALGEGHDLVDLTSQSFGYGNVVLEGGDGNDVLWASAGDDVLVGGRGNDELSGGAGEDLYVHAMHGGHDAIDEAGVSSQLDVLRFGEGITQQMVRVRREHRDLILDVAGPHGSVTIKGWFDSSAKRVEAIEFADGTSWDEEDLRERARRSDGICDAVDNGHRRDDDHHLHDDHGRRGYGHGHHGEDERDGNHVRDQLAEWIGQRLARAPRFDFEALTRQAERGAQDSFHVAQRWQAAARYARALGEDPEDDERRAAPSGLQRSTLAGLFGAGSTGFGFESSVGAARGSEHLRSLEGLTEGFRRL